MLATLATTILSVGKTVLACAGKVIISAAKHVAAFITRSAVKSFISTMTTAGIVGSSVNFDEPISTTLNAQDGLREIEEGVDECVSGSITTGTEKIGYGLFKLATAVISVVSKQLVSTINLDQGATLKFIR